MKCILGAGLSGLIAGYYLKDYQVIGEVVGGQLRNQFGMASRIMNATKQVFKFLVDIDIPFSIKEYKIGYYSDGKIFDEPPDFFRELYVQKTRNTFDVFDSTMNSNRTRTTGFVFDYDLLIKKLLESIGSRLVNSRVRGIRIDGDDVVFGMPKILEVYKKVISTVSIKTFSKLLEDKSLEKFLNSIGRISGDIYFSKATKEFMQSAPFDCSDYDIVYIANKETPINRISKVGSEYFLELVDTMKGSSLSCQCAKDLKIVKNLDLHQWCQIEFLGRFARWDNKYKLDDVVDYATKISGNAL